jgi:hypothetical protein
MSRATKPSTLRYRAMLADVRQRVLFAFSTKNYVNPYDVEDKRHSRFSSGLARTLAVDSDFEDMCQAMGSDTSQWTPRVHPDPGPVVAVEDLAYG